MLNGISCWLPFWQVCHSWAALRFYYTSWHGVAPNLFMANYKLPNYIRARRKSAGLSQEEVAFLLGFHSSHLSRYERFRRKPGFRIAIGFEVIFNTSVRVLFSGDFHAIENAICRRARRLARQLKTQKPDHLTVRKLAYLEKITAAADR
jgi:transcriptional regulator with XRE-family HTH domain